MKQQENRAEPQEKQIRFIDSHYNLKFYIPDGGKIRITFRDGHTADRVCKYIDDYHLYVGNCCYPICEFAEKCKFIKVKQCEKILRLWLRDLFVSGFVTDRAGKRVQTRHTLSL